VVPSKPSFFRAIPGSCKRLFLSCSLFFNIYICISSRHTARDCLYMLIPKLGTVRICVPIFFYFESDVVPVSIFGLIKNTEAIQKIYACYNSAQPTVTHTQPIRTLQSQIDPDCGTKCVSHSTKLNTKV
jgi:hypothetical protein